MSTLGYEMFINCNKPIGFKIPTPQPNPFQRRMMASAYAEAMQSPAETCIEGTSIGYWNLNYYKSASGTIYLIYQYFDEIKYCEKM